MNWHSCLASIRDNLSRGWDFQTTSYRLTQVRLSYLECCNVIAFGLAIKCTWDILWPVLSAVTWTTILI